MPDHMSAIDHLLALADEYARVADVDTTTTSWRLFGDSKKLGAIQQGADIQVRRLERAVRWFSENWPAAAVWPRHVPRPVAGPVSSEVERFRGEDTSGSMPEPVASVTRNDGGAFRP